MRGLVVAIGCFSQIGFANGYLSTGTLYDKERGNTYVLKDAGRFYRSEEPLHYKVKLMMKPWAELDDEEQIVDGEPLESSGASNQTVSSRRLDETTKRAVDPKYRYAPWREKDDKKQKNWQGQVPPKEGLDEEFDRLPEKEKEMFRQMAYVEPSETGLYLCMMYEDPMQDQHIAWQAAKETWTTCSKLRAWINVFGKCIEMENGPSETFGKIDKATTVSNKNYWVYFGWLWCGESKDPSIITTWHMEWELQPYNQVPSVWKNLSLHEVGVQWTHFCTLVVFFPLAIHLAMTQSKEKPNQRYTTRKWLSIGVAATALGSLLMSVHWASYAFDFPNGLQACESLGTLILTAARMMLDMSPLVMCLGCPLMAKEEYSRMFYSVVTMLVIAGLCAIIREFMKPFEHGWISPVHTYDSFQGVFLVCFRGFACIEACKVVLKLTPLNPTTQKDKVAQDLHVATAIRTAVASVALYFLLPTSITIAGFMNPWTRKGITAWVDFGSSSALALTVVHTYSPSSIDRTLARAEDAALQYVSAVAPDSSVHDFPEELDHPPPQPEARQAGESFEEEHEEDLLADYREVAQGEKGGDKGQAQGDDREDIGIDDIGIEGES